MKADPMDDRAEYDPPHELLCQAEVHVRWRYDHPGQDDDDVKYTGVGPTTTRRLTPEEQGVEPHFPEEDRDLLQIYPDGSMSIEDGETLLCSRPLKRGEAATIKSLVNRLNKCY